MALETRYIAQLDRHITRLGLGALPMGPLQRRLTADEGARVVRAAVEGGITYIDTATVYGTYDHIAQGLAGWTGPVTVSTKTHARSNRQLAEEHIELALRGLKREPIDIMLCHCARSLFTGEEWGPTFDALLAARDRGLIRLLGLSSHTVEGVRIAARHPEMDVVHPLYNMTGMGIIDGTAQDMLAAIREAKAAGMFIYGMKPLAGGNLVPQREEALDFVFGTPEVDVVAMGMVTTEEVEWNLRYASGQAIPDDLRDRTAMHSKRLCILEVACEGCGECVKACENEALQIIEKKARVNADRCILCGYCAPVCPMFAIRIV